MHDRYTLQFFLLQVLSFGIIMIQIYYKLANDNSKVGKIPCSLCILDKQVKSDIHILRYSWNYKESVKK